MRLPATFPATFGVGAAIWAGSFTALAGANISHGAVYQPADRLTVGADAVADGRTTLRGHRIPGSTVYVTKG